MDNSSGYIRDLISKRYKPLSKELKGSILVIDTGQPDCERLLQILRSAGHTADSRSLQAAGPDVESGNYDLLLVDLADVEQVLGMLTGKAKASAKPRLIALLDSHSPDKLVEIIRLGVGDCIPRPLHHDYTLLVIKRALEHLHLLRKAEEGERYKRISKLDSLTELYNHRHFHELLSVELERAVRDHAPVTVLMIDVDRFKAYNDTNGHLAGDAALKQIASILDNSVRSYDIVARYGGEEFALMLPGTDQDRGMIVAKRLVERVGSALFDAGDSQPERRLTISIGVASFPTYGRDKDTLIAGADSAMYSAKAQGGNSVCAAVRDESVSGAKASA